MFLVMIYYLSGYRHFILLGKLLLGAFTRTDSAAGSTGQLRLAPLMRSCGADRRTV